MERDDEEEEEEFPINFRESSLFTMDQIKGSNSTRILSFNAQSMNNTRTPQTLVQTSKKI